MDKPRKPDYAEACVLEEITDLSRDGQESLEKLLAYLGDLEEYTDFLQDEMDELENTDDVVDPDDDPDEYVIGLEAQLENTQLELEMYRQQFQQDLQLKAEHALYRAQLDAIRLVTR